MKLVRLLDGKTAAFPAPVPELRCDVLCVGAGSAGVYAASAAAESGARVILLENDVTVGGMHVLGGVRGLYYGAPGGSYEADCTPGSPHYYGKNDYKRPRLLRRLRQSGAELRCGCTPTGLLLDGNRVRGLTFFDGSRELAVEADMVIDATSDGFLLRILPVEKQYAGAVPYSVMATCHEGDGFREVNRDAGFLDPYDPDDFSRKTVLAHADAAKLLKKGPLLQLASHTGIRQGLSFRGRERLQIEDVLLERVPERVLFWAYSDLDIHGHLRALDEELFQTWWVLCNLATVAVRIPVPLGAVVPEGFLGIVTAGRCMSADHYALSAVRMNRDMFRMGECVGVAAAMAKDGDLMAIDGAEYLRRVEARGCFAGDISRHRGFDSPRRDVPYTPLEEDPEKALPLLQTDRPGAFFWAVFRAEERKNWADRLAKLLREAKDPLFRGNLALALGLLEDARALPELRRLVMQRDDFWFRDCRRSNQFRCVMAVCLLGRVGSRQDIDLLRPLVFDAEEADRSLYRALKADRLRGTGDRNFLYFDLFTHAGAALIKLYKKWGLPLEALRRSFAELLKSGEAERRCAPNGGADSPARWEIRHFLQVMQNAN